MSFPERIIPSSRSLELRAQLAPWIPQVHTSEWHLPVLHTLLILLVRFTRRSEFLLPFSVSPSLSLSLLHFFSSAGELPPSLPSSHATPPRHPSQPRPPSGAPQPPELSENTDYVVSG